MEVGGDGGGLPEARSGELESLLEAIKSSEVSWDDSGCSGVSHCMLHKSILQVALKCSCIDMTDCLGQFLALGAKIISMTLNISIKLLPSAAKCITVDMVHTIGDFISELLSLPESSIVDNKKIHGAATISLGLHLFFWTKQLSCAGYTLRPQKQIVASPDEVLVPLSALRKVAHSVCIILSYASSATVDQSYSKNHRAINVPTSSWGVIGFPVHALASALQRCEIKDDSIIDEKSITAMFKFTISLINMYGTAPDSGKDHLAKHISSMLDIISNTRHLCAFSEMERLTLQLHTLFLSTSGNSNAVLSQCKPSMASFMAILGHLNLWKFIPGDAALSYNASTGTSVDENGFMLELRAYLQKEAALHTDRWSEEQFQLLVSEGRALKKLVEAYSEIPVVSEPEKVVITKDSSTKKRKVPDDICEGMVLLQNGLKAMRGAFAEADFAELKDRFTAHLSRLEDAVSQIASLSDEI
ncbi:uncharacterized protein C2845_PM01G02820 [Panicum miliaceum]|uniref:Uncharacterized protein n=1 Tax=Panicum miliaceum TaxID=4540 RepID=A0A3L6TTB5_PANMI|nr:uncharacterized protein C2845_PM01G02820 [Panicum miliaceum]